MRQNSAVASGVPSERIRYFEAYLIWTDILQLVKITQPWKLTNAFSTPLFPPQHLSHVRSGTLILWFGLYLDIRERDPHAVSSRGGEDSDSGMSLCFMGETAGFSNWAAVSQLKAVGDMDFHRRVHGGGPICLQPWQEGSTCGCNPAPLQESFLARLRRRERLGDWERDFPYAEPQAVKCCSLAHNGSCRESYDENK